MKQVYLQLFVLTFIGVHLVAQPLAFTDAEKTILTIAGRSVDLLQDQLLPDTAEIRSVSGVAIGEQGELFLAAPDDHVVLRLYDGKLSVFAGNQIRGISQQSSPAARTSLDDPYALAYDARNRSLFIADRECDCIYRVKDGVLSRFAGSAQRQATVDLAQEPSEATRIHLKRPEGLAVDENGNVYISDTGNGVVRRVDQMGIATTFAGHRSGSACSSDSGRTVREICMSPRGLAYHPGTRRLFIVDATKRPIAIRSIYLQGQEISRLTVSDMLVSVKEVPAAIAAYERGVLAVYTLSDQLEEITEDVAPLVHTPRELRSPSCVAAVGRAVYVCTGASGLSSVASWDTLVPILPARSRQIEDVHAAQLLATPWGIVSAPDGTVYVADTNNNRIVKIGARGLEQVAGTGEPGFRDDDIATRGRLRKPKGLALAANGDLYISDAGNGRIRKVSHQDGSLRTVAGQEPSKCLNLTSQRAEVSASELCLNDPRGLALNELTGELYVADSGNHVIIALTLADNRRAYKLAGTGRRAPSNTGVPSAPSAASSAEFALPSGLAFDPKGFLYVADSDRAALRRINLQSKMLDTIAGTGSHGRFPPLTPSPDQNAKDFLLNFPTGVAVDKQSGAIYIADYEGNRVYRLLNGIIGIVSGGDRPGFFGDGGSPSNALLSSPTAVAISDSALLIADAGNHRIRRSSIETPELLLREGATIDLNPPPNAEIATGSIAVDGNWNGIEFSASIKSTTQWLTLRTPANSTFKTPARLPYEAVFTSLNPGTYKATIALSGVRKELPLKPVEITVTLIITRPPPWRGDAEVITVLAPDKAPVELSGLVADSEVRDVVSFLNTGTYDLDVRIVPKPDAPFYLTAWPSDEGDRESGIREVLVRAGESVRYAIAARTDGLAAGEYRGGLEIAANAKNAQLDVLLKLSSPTPRFSVAPTSLEIQSHASYLVEAQDVMVFNTSAAEYVLTPTIRYVDSTDIGWLRLRDRELSMKPFGASTIAVQADHHPSGKRREACINLIMTAACDVRVTVNPNSTASVSVTIAGVGQLNAAGQIVSPDGRSLLMVDNSGMSFTFKENMSDKRTFEFICDSKWLQIAPERIELSTNSRAHTVMVQMNGVPDRTECADGICLGHLKVIERASGQGAPKGLWLQFTFAYRLPRAASTLTSGSP